MALSLLYAVLGRTPPEPQEGDRSFDGPANDHLIGLWEFGRGAGAQNTALAGDGSRNMAPGGEDAALRLDQGMIVVSFTQDGHAGQGDDTIISHGDGSGRAAEGYFGLLVGNDGAVKLEHHVDGAELRLTTDAGFLGSGDTIRVVYGFDAARGAIFGVENVTAGEVFTATIGQTGLSLDFGAGEAAGFRFGAHGGGDGQGEHLFHGEIDHVALYDTVDPLGGGGLDGIVEGTPGNDLIDLGYTGDPEGDRIDNGDAILPGAAPDDDVVLAGAGNDRVFAGEGDDVIFGGAGRDTLVGGAGADKIYGGEGSDLIFGDGGGGGQPGGVTLTFEGEEAGFRNLVGIYEIDPDSGEISAVRVAFANASEPGSGGDLTPGSSESFAVSSGADIGVFIVANGAALNDIGSLGEGTFSFVDVHGDPATTATDNPQLIFTSAEGQQTAIAGNAFHSAGFGVNAGLNVDDRIHTDVLSADAHSVKFGFEDLTQDVTDDDFNDSVLTLGIDGVDARFGLADWKTGTVTTVSGMAATDGGGAGDMLVGNDGNDAIFGGIGDDTIDGGSGNDRLFGEDGDDKIFGGKGNDQIRGGAGNDTIIGGPGNDVMRGEDDRDTFKGFGNTDNDVVFGGAGGDDHDTLDLTGSAGEGTLKVIIQGPDSDGNGFDGKVEYFDQDGAKTGQIVFKNIEKIIPCFTPGTRIATPRGEVPVEDLRVGDRVITRDHGLQTVRWIGGRALSRTELALAPDLRPVRIRAGALGHGLPERDMQVSPNHRMLVMNDRTQLFFDEAEVLVAAKHLADGDGIAQVEADGVTYIHLMFDHHEVVLADGCWSESFQPGDWSLKGLDNDQRAELFDLFPELTEERGREGYRAARRSLKKHEARLLIGG